VARIRTIKPEFFAHWDLYELEVEVGLPVRIAFAGLWTLADREGRFKWVPQQLKLGCLPYDDVDFSRVLDALTTRDFVVKYTVNNVDYGVISGFSDHQVINNREAESRLPEPNNINTLTRAPRVTDACTTSEVHAQAEGKEGREGKGSTEPLHDSVPEDVVPEITIPLVDKSEFPVTHKMISEWEEAYPAVAVLQKLREIRQWNISNPKRQKTSRGILKHITSWLAKEQDKGGILKGQSSQQPHTPALREYIG